MTNIPDRIEILSASELRTYPQNPRTHSPAQITRIVASMQEFGWTSPVLIDDENWVIAGHGRLLAARHLGIDKIPTIRLRHLTPAQARAYRIADNRLALDADWDEQLLALEFNELLAIDYDITLTGFTEDELDGYLSNQEGFADGKEPPVSLSDRFGIPPFTVFNAREGWWQNRKRAWVALGIESELGRGEDITYGSSPEITEPGLNYYRNKKSGTMANPKKSTWISRGAKKAPPRKEKR